MGAFRVHGVTEQTASKAAAKKLKQLQANQMRLGGGLSLPTIEDLQAEFYKKMKPVQISEPFDAPQFCMDFINTAERTMKCRALKVMVFKEKLKKGVVVTSKRTGRPLKSWQPY